MGKMSTVEKFFVNRLNKYFYRKTLQSLEEVLKVSNSSSVLEIGAGIGTLAVLINEKYSPAKLLVTDYDEEQVELAKQNIEGKYGSVPQSFALEKADALDLHYPDDAFDCILAFAVFHHLGKEKEVCRGLDEVGRVLKTGGQLAYGELLHKKKIREYLLNEGFKISYRKKRLFGLAEVVVATKLRKDEQT